MSADLVANVAAALASSAAVGSFAVSSDIGGSLMPRSFAAAPG
eukprot:CAMPEP_0206175956 /NCGR_PEP_ID=MMETSP1474-20131121/56705_1 /ASSEMBLY_ACC=CAM_ASM_001110 /TAXON_ID=97495 /ORGANISM="Imantonia sp., Strain RCC918" /LENGTH=42 /DNA_ID= /DNA_START= /DNA_END= /DNA_ORIENTATION=